MKWASDTIITFFSQYMKYPCLWDVNSADYKDRNKRFCALQEIINALGIEGLDMTLLKTKIHSLRNTYLNELAKVRKSKQTCTSEADVYTPKIPWFKIADSFLRGVVRKRETYSNLGLKSHSDGPCRTQECGTEEDDSSEAFPKIEAAWTQIDDFVAHEQRQEEFNHLDNVHGFRDVPLRALQEDELDLFGKSVAAQMKKLPEEYAIELTAEIQTLITKKRLKAIAHKRSTMSSFVSSPSDNHPIY